MDQAVLARARISIGPRGTQPGSTTGPSRSPIPRSIETGARAANAFTGTLPDYRGRGLGRLVKLAVVRRLAELGIVRLLTVNHDENAAMLAINERLGFAPAGALYNYVRESGNGLRASAGSTCAVTQTGVVT